MKKLLTLLFASLLIFACNKEPVDQLPDDWYKPGTDVGGGSAGNDYFKLPEAATNNVCAHRGGSAEAGKSHVPDNSIASLLYAINLKCFASECDIYCTKDNRVIVAHADGNCMVNGMHPWEYTLAEIRAGGKLSNGEEIPTLEEYIDCLLKNTKCTKLWLDIKNITVPSTLTQYPSKACELACKIITEKKANDVVEFICTGNATVMQNSFIYCNKAKISIAWMANKSVSDYIANGYNWANLSYEYVTEGGGNRKIDDYLKSGLEFSVYTVDDPNMMNLFIGYGDKLKAISTNYPKRLLDKL